MQLRYTHAVALCAILLFNGVGAVFAQETSGAQTDATPTQRLEIMRSRLETMRRSLNSAIAATSSDEDDKKKDKKAAPTDDSRGRLRGLEQEVSAIIKEVFTLRSKLDRRERLEDGALDKLDISIADIDTRVQAGLRATTTERTAANASESSKNSSKKKKKGGLFSRLLGRDDDNDYEELTGTVAPGRDRVLFEEATRQVRKGSYDTGRLLYSTIITTYPDSVYLPLSKLAIADTFYLEGTTAALIQAGAAYQDWLTFFPTDPLADDVMLKMAEAEMRQMGLADRDVTHARKAEQRLKVLMQQFPGTILKKDVELRLQEVQENLAKHTMQVGDFYYERNRQQKGGLKGAQSRYREVVDKYPNYSGLDKTLYRLGITYLEEEEPDEAAKYFQRIMRDYPNSEYAQKSRERLEVIGAEVPAPNPQRVNMVQPERPSFTQNLITEMLGNIDITVDKNGVLISKDKDNAGNDLIDKAIQRGGTLPDDVTPTAPVQRTAPARTFTQSTTTTTTTAKPAGTPANQTGESGSAPQSQPGQTPGGSQTPAQPVTPQSTTPATNTTTTAPATKP